MEQPAHLSAEKAVEVPRLIEVFAENEYELFGVKGTLVDLKAMCPVDPNRMTPEAENRFVIMAVNEAGGEVPPEHTGYFKQVLERQGVEPKFVVAEPKVETVKTVTKETVTEVAEVPHEAISEEPPIEPAIEPAPDVIEMESEPVPEVKIVVAQPGLTEVAELPVELPIELIAAQQAAPETVVTVETPLTAPQLVTTAEAALAELQTPPLEEAITEVVQLDPNQAEIPLLLPDIADERVFNFDEAFIVPSATDEMMPENGTDFGTQSATPPLESSQESWQERLPVPLQEIMQQPPLSLQELLPLASHLAAPENQLLSTPESAEATVSQPISQEVLTYAHEMFETEPDREQAVIRLVDEARQISEMLVAAPELLDSPHIAAVADRLKAVCHQILEQLQIEPDEARLQRFVQAFLREEVITQYQIEVEPAQLDEGTHESKLADWFNTFMHQIDFQKLAAPFAGRLALRIRIDA